MLSLLVLVLILQFLGLVSGYSGSLVRQCSKGTIKTKPPAPPLRLRLSDVVQDDNIFRIHFASASFFGGALLLVPHLLPGNNVLTEAIYQSWSLFILAVAAIAFKAPSFPADVKQWLRLVLGTMLGGEFLLSVKSIATGASAGILTPYALSVDAVSAVIYLSLSVGYFVAETSAKK